jgi:hypothetical protein
MERIDPIRRDESPWVAPAARLGPVERRQPGDQEPRKRRPPRPQPEADPEARPDADGHIDVSV